MINTQGSYAICRWRPWRLFHSEYTRITANWNARYISIQFPKVLIQSFSSCWNVCFNLFSCTPLQKIICISQTSVWQITKAEENTWSRLNCTSASIFREHPSSFKNVKSNTSFKLSFYVYAWMTSTLIDRLSLYTVPFFDTEWSHL